MKKRRIISVDVMRGLSLLGMMLVNLTPDEGMSFSALVHTEWCGISLADCFFPCFVFLTGVSAALNAERKLFGQGWFLSALKRGVSFLLIGLVYYHLPYLWSLLFNKGYGFTEFFRDITTYFRPFGVLQRIGFAYFFAVVLYHFLKSKKANLIAAFVILAVTTLGFYLYQPSAPFSETDNISIYVDQALQGSNHNHMQKIFDPEGLYGNFTAIASVLLGLVTGMILSEQNRMGLVVRGTLLALFGWFVSSFVMVSKPLWTASYVLILSGAFMVILAVLDDILPGITAARKLLKPAEFIGAHSMLTYLVSGSLEALLNAVKIGDKNLYHFLWEGTVFMPDFPEWSCLIGSLIVIAFVCVIVLFCGKLTAKRKLNK